MGDEVALLPADKHKSFRQVDSISLVVQRRACQSTQNNKFAIFSNISRKIWKIKLIYFLQMNIKCFKVDFNFSDIKGFYLLMGILKHFQSAQGNKSTISLQSLEKEVKDWVARHVQSTQSRKLVIVLQYNKKVSQPLLSSIVMQNIQIFYEASVMLVVTCFILTLLVPIRDEEKKLS